MILIGDCVEWMSEMDAESVDAIVTDPPYGLEFMGKEWDGANGFRRSLNPADVARDDPFGRASRTSPEYRAGAVFERWTEQWASEALRVLKPGGHLLAFGGTRTYHRLAAGIEDAGFEIRDCITWMYGSGFPKSLDVSKAIDKRRYDVEDVRVVCRWLRRVIDGSDQTAGSIAKTFGFHQRMVEHWAARDSDSQPTLPTLRQWDCLREMLGFDGEMDAEVLRLNLRKGEPGEAWADRPVTGEVVEWLNRSNYALTSRDGLRRDTPATADAERWQGWGTALKPAGEPIVVARKPLIGTVAKNVLAHGTGALNIAATRIGMSDSDRAVVDARSGAGFNADVYGDGMGRTEGKFTAPPGGRWPANVILSHDENCQLVGTRNVKRNMIVSHAEDSPGKNTYGSGGPGGGSHSAGSVSEEVERWACVESCSVRMMDDMTNGVVHGAGVARKGAENRTVTEGNSWLGTRDSDTARMHRFGDKGGASRFFYNAKSSRAERNAGLFDYFGNDLHKNNHPTVKPINVMRWLVRLVTPPGGTVLDPFMGSGTTGCAAALEGFDFIGIEMNTGYAEIAEARIRHYS